MKRNIIFIILAIIVILGLIHYGSVKAKTHLHPITCPDFLDRDHPYIAAQIFMLKNSATYLDANHDNIACNNLPMNHAPKN